MKLNLLIGLLNQYSDKFGEQNILQILCDTDNNDNVQIGFGKPNYNQDKECDDHDKSDLAHEYVVINKLDTKKCLGVYPLQGLAENIIKFRSDPENWTIMELDVSE